MKKLLNTSLICLLITFFASCNEEETPVSPDLTITSFSPTSATVGTEVTITGTGFSTTASENQVSFNGTAATVTAATATTITTEVPTGASNRKHYCHSRW